MSVYGTPHPDSARECALYAPVKAALESRGWTVYAEVPPPIAGAGPIDVVAAKPGHRLPLVVELKCGFTKPLLRQCCLAQLVTPLVFAAAPTEPRLAWLSQARTVGIGAVRVEGGKCRVVLLPRTRLRQFYARAMLVRLKECEEHRSLVGGVPTQRGDGPAQTTYRLVRKFRQTHPGATWREIYAAVPSHYVSHRSMSGAMKYAAFKVEGGQ